MKLLVTGGMGFQGAALSTYWAQAGHVVTVLNTPSQRAIRREQELRDVGVRSIVWGSVTDAEVITKAIEGQDAVIHLAAWASVDASIREPMAALAVNLIGTYRVLEAVRRHPCRLIAASSCEVLGAPVSDDPQDEHAPLNSQSPYAASKAAADRLCFAYAHTYGVHATILRPSNVYGPGQYAGSYGAVIPIFVSRALAGLPMCVRGDGRQQREYLHITDLVRGYDSVLSAETHAGEVFHLGSGEIVSVLDIARMIQAETGTAIEYAEARPGEVATFRLDSTKAKRELGWQATVPFTDGLKEYLAWARQQ